MGILFISHSRQDNDAAIKVRDWLKSRGWKDVFLDLDPEHGMTPGRNWQLELKQAGERCSGVLVLLSQDWLGSPWCRTEYLVADQLGKKIFPLFVAPMAFDDLPAELKTKFQIVDISDPAKEADGFERLAIGLKRAGLDPTSFEWPPPADPHRPIFRGLQSLDEEDAAIFFGRDAQITDGLDALRRMRDGASKRMLVILGASGAGKSSFLKAGLIARLKRDEENFLVLPVIRPERAALSGQHGLAAALSCDPATLIASDDLLKAFGARRAKAMDRQRRYAESAHETFASQSPTIVIAIDQAEELFAAENTEAASALELLAAAVLADSNAIIVATIRSDSFAKMQDEPRLAELSRLPFDLAPIPHGAFKDVIEGPARLANPPLAIEPALTERLLKDLAADDALPLLAFTLERLLRQHRGSGALTLSEYTYELGGLQGAITAAVESAFEKARRDPSISHDRAALDRLARMAFIPALVQIDEADAEPGRRVERLAALPEATRPLLRHLIAERLLVTDHRLTDGAEADTVEVAHEAILRQWPALRSWIAEEREALRTLDTVRAAAAEWRRHGGGTGWLTHGGARLDEAEQLLAPDHFANALGTTERQYLGACRARDNTERERERNDIERDKRHIARTARLQRNIFAVLGVAVAIVLITGLGMTQLLKGIAVRSSDALAKLSEQAADNQDYERAARYATAGLVGSDWPILGYSGERAERALRTANVLSKRLFILQGHGDVVNAAAYSPNGTRIVTASSDRTARVWDARTGAPIAILRGHGDVVYGAAYSPDGTRIVTASFDKTARVWNARTGTQLLVLRGHEGNVNGAAFSPDGARIVTVSDDKTARIWDAASGAQIGMLSGHEGIVDAVAFSPDGSRIVTASADKTARIWDATTDKQITVLRGHASDVVAAAFSPDGTHIITASLDRTARIWDARSGAQVGALGLQSAAVSDVVYSRDGQRILTASADRTARIWDALSGAQIAVFWGHNDIVNSAAFSPDGSRVVTASFDRTARVWDAKTGEQVIVLRLQDGTFRSAAYSPDGARIVTTSDDETTRIWDARTGAKIIDLPGHDAVENAGFSPDGLRIVTTSDDKTARIWDSRTGRQSAVLQGHQDAVVNAAFSPDGKRIVTASFDKTARIWDARTGRPLGVLRGHNDIVYAAAFSPDGARIVTASADRTARVWDASRGAQLAVLRAHDADLQSAAYSPDGRHIVTASFDQTARIWDAATGAPVAVLRGHEGHVHDASYSRDGARVVTASSDRTVRIWDARTGAGLAVLWGHDGAIYSATYSPDGTHILTASSDKTARIWKTPRIDMSWLSLTRPALVERTCSRLLSKGLDHFSNEELAAAPDLDPKLDADACHPPSLWTRLRELLSASSSK